MGSSFISVRSGQPSQMTYSSFSCHSEMTRKMARPGSFLLVVMFCAQSPPPPPPYRPQYCHCLRCRRRSTGGMRWARSSMLSRIEFLATIGPPPHLTGIQLWANICAHLNFELRDCLITFPIFVPSQRLIARNVRELRYLTQERGKYY